mgnify:CR=1 FL=1
MVPRRVGSTRGRMDARRLLRSTSSLRDLRSCCRSLPWITISAVLALACPEGVEEPLGGPPEGGASFGDEGDAARRTVRVTKATSRAGRCAPSTTTVRLDPGAGTGRPAVAEHPTGRRERRIPGGNPATLGTERADPGVRAADPRREARGWRVGSARSEGGIGAVGGWDPRRPRVGSAELEGGIRAVGGWDRHGWGVGSAHRSPGCARGGHRAARAERRAPEKRLDPGQSNVQTSLATARRPPRDRRRACAW